MENNSKLIIAGIIFALFVIFFIRSQSEDTQSKYWQIPSTTCELEHEDAMCSSYVIECIAHIEKDYEWDGNIKCINGQCVCTMR